MKIDTPKRSFMKSISWRILSLVITFTVSILVTGKLDVAIYISIFDTIIKMFVYYVHERHWTNVRWGRIKRKKLHKKRSKKHIKVN